MVAQVEVYHIDGRHRSQHIAHAMAEGIRRVGDRVSITPVSGFTKPKGDVACFYGFDRGLDKIFAAYRKADKPVVYIDLGYWGRRYMGTRMGYHKISVNDRHPTAYFQDVRHPCDRANRLGLKLEPWKSGSFILLAGMSARAALVAGFGPEYWERNAVEKLRRYTDRPIVYRPKPNWIGAQPIQGAEFAHNKKDIDVVLRDCHAVVTHHSNVGVEALVAGVPVFSDEGIASKLALNDLSKIEAPNYDGDRQRFIQDAAYCQWNVVEMRVGAPWRHLKSEGLIP